MLHPARPSNRLDVRRCWEAPDRQDKERADVRFDFTKLLVETQKILMEREPEQEPFLGEIFRDEKNT